ncbi:MAG: SpoVA/SpoVAEb family sporulation membrane protein [Lachnospiraceae bacterium]|nr:SpoVA/SpoVAEb family sporulation membrane protein [Lachnospiraceae bacterium]
MKEFVTIQDSPKHKLLRAYDSDLGVQNPIGEADFHGFCICNCEGTEQLQEFLEFRRQQPDEQGKQQYNQYVKDVTPTHGLGSQMMKAFVTGGIICCMGQWIINYALGAGLDKETAGSWCSLILVLLSAVLTGFNIFPSIAKWGGAGALVPITGFANSVAAPAIEYQKEGQVFGIGCKIFTIAGPVILYGIFTSWVLGLGYWVLKILGII